jgi:ribosome-binding factor A
MGIGHTAEKLSEEMLRKLSYIILYKLKVELNSKMVSITKVEISPDRAFAKVYISVIEGKEIGLDVIKKLNRVKRVITRLLLKSMYIKKVPVFTFVYDDTIEKSVRLNKMLDELVSESKSDEW